VSDEFQCRRASAQQHATLMFTLNLASQLSDCLEFGGECGEVRANMVLQRMIISIIENLKSVREPSLSDKMHYGLRK
jgi:hypothetical protein